MQLSRALRISAGDVVALVGGGGKTTALFRLAQELSQKKMRVLTTTTTRIFSAQIQRAPAHLKFNPTRQTVADILPQLNHLIDHHQHALLIGQADPESGKAFGIPPEVIDALAASGHFDVILNEADGSRMRPFKAPAEHEPVIPASTTLVVPVVGIDALGQPLHNNYIHRAERVSRLSGTPLNAPVTANTVAAVLSHAGGGLKNVPAQARVIPLLNKVANSAALALARSIAAQTLQTGPQIEAVAIGAAQTSNPVSEVQGRTAAVLLAAGNSSRFGSPKQLARWGGQTFIERVADAALNSQAEPVVVVLGAEIEQSRAALAGRPVNIIINPDWAKGQSASLKAGLAALPPNISSVVFLLVDLPGITPNIIDALIARHRQTLAPLVWPEFEGRRGNPVLFDRNLFAELAAVSGDTGGKPVLMAHQDNAERVAVTDEAIVQDIDRLQDLENLGKKP